MMNKICVTGGLGYIGSHTVVELIQSGYQPVIIDDLSNSSLSVLDNIEAITEQRPEFYQFDLCDEELTLSCFQEQDFDAVIHFAAFKAIGESFDKPLKYYANNLGSLISVLHAMKKYHVAQFVFSSSAAVYGPPAQLPLTENTPLNPPTNPYGYTKLMGEQIIRDTANNWPELSSVLLRYFNPIGAHDSGLIGELPKYPNNLLPYITQTALGKRQELTIFGNTYATEDGSCVRDYVHVSDVAQAHVLALEYIQNKKGLLDVFNIGIGQGYSVLEIVQTFERVNGKKINYTIGPKRTGDVPVLYTDSSRAQEVMKWSPKYDLDQMLQSAWQFEQKIGKK